MRIKLFFLTGALFAIIGRVGAGSIELAPKETEAIRYEPMRCWSQQQGQKNTGKKRVVLAGGELVFLVSANTSASETRSGINQL